MLARAVDEFLAPEGVGEEEYRSAVGLFLVDDERLNALPGLDVKV